jgi:signal transduction histidine kinase
MGMSRTIDDFRHFFEPVTQRESFVLEDAVRKAVSMLSPLLESAGVSVEVSISADLVVEGFESQLIQIFLNLMGNSLDAFEARSETDNSKCITFEAALSEGSIRLKVRDTAGGIDEAVIRHVFDPYFTTKGDKGTGLGLYMAKVIVENNFYGTLSVENGSKGACFTLSMPRGTK